MNSHMSITKIYDKKNKHAIIRELAWILLLLIFCAGTQSWGQTNPTAQNLPYSQNFGTNTFTTVPTGMAVWNGINGGSVNTQALAEASAPTGNATLTAQTSVTATGGSFGYSATSNGRFYIQTSSNATNGVNQIALAIVTSGLTDITVAYDVEIISAQPRTVGIVMQYRTGTSGSWTTVSGTGNPYSQAGGTAGVKVSPTLVLPAGANNQSVVQIRWATWRGSETGNSSGIAIDNISVTGTAATPNIALSSPTIPTNAVNNNTTNNIIGAIQLDVTTADATLNSVTLTTAGTYSAADIATNGFKFWLGNSATDLTSATQLGTAQTAVGTGSTVSISGLSTIINNATTRYIILTADIASSPTNGATIGIATTEHSDITFASGTKSGTDPIAAGTTRSISVATADIDLSSPTSSTSNISQGAINQEIYRFDLTVTTAAATLNGVTITTAGSYLASDLTNIKCWYSVDNIFNSGADELLSTKTTSLGIGSHVFPTFSSKTILSGNTGYIFITTDLPYTATSGNIISVNAITTSDISFLSGNKTGTSSASGTKTIVECTPTNVSGLTATPGNTTISISWTNPSCLDEIMIVAKPTSSITTSPAGDGSAYTANLTFGTGSASAFDGSGYVVYKGTSSSQTLTGLTNGITYFIEVFTRKGNTWSTGNETSATPNLTNAPAILWGSSGGSAWLTTGNWTGGSTPTTLQTAQFGTNPSGTSIGVNMGGSTNNGSANQIVGAIEVTNNRLAALNIGNSSGSTSGTLTLSGVIVNATENIILRNNSTQTLTIQANQSSAMTITLGNTSENVVLINGTGGITITSNIIGASKHLLKKGTGSGILTLEGANTFSGNTTVTEGTLQLNRAGGTTLPTTNNVIINGGIFRVSSNQTLNNLTLTSGELIVDAGITLTINGTLTYTSGTITLNGNLAYGTSSTILFHNTSSYTTPASLFTNSPTNVSINASAGVTLGSSATINGILTLSSGTLSLGANSLTVNGSISNTSGNIDASNSSASVIFGGASTQNIPNSTFAGNINNLTISNSNGVTNNQLLTISGTLILNAGIFDANNITTISSGASLVFNGGSITNYNMPATLNNYTIPSGTTELTSNLTISGDLNIGSNMIDIGSNTLTVNGNVTRTTGTIKTNEGTLILGGTNSSTLYFDQTNDGVTNKLKDLTVNRTGATVTLGNKLQIAHNGTVTVTEGILNANSNLVLTSTLSGTGRIAELGSGASITGNVEVQRYMVGGASSQRGWRYMSSPVANATYAQLVDDIFITGPGGTTNGFDASGSNSSVMTYEESTNRGWKNITATSNTWATGKGAIVFFRGDRTQTNSITNPGVAPNSFALDFFGNINSGDFTINLDYDNTTGVAADQGWNLIGNPYPSQINWDLVTRTGGVNSHYYLINPTSKNYVSDNTGVIAIGQGFFVQVNANGQSVTFEENDKTGSNGTAYFKTASNPLTIKMNLDSVQHDVAKIFFVNHANKNYLFTEDAIKLKNPVYNLSIVTPNNIEVQNNYVPNLGVAGSDTFYLNVTSTTNNSYQLNFENFLHVPANKVILLIDKLNNSITNVRLVPSYPFTINNNQSNTFGNRFLLVITDQQNPLPVKLIQFHGINNGLHTTLKWVTASEKNLIGFEVQKSEDGINYETIGLVKAVNQNSTTKYNFNENKLIYNKNYYRLKIIENSGVEYSNVVVVSSEHLPSNGSLVKLYPNPADRELNVVLTPNNNIQKVNIFDIHGKLWLTTESPTGIDITRLNDGNYIIELEVDGNLIRTKFNKQSN